MIAAPIKEFGFYYLGAIFVEVLVLPFLSFYCALTRLGMALSGRRKKPDIFMGTMYINNWAYVAKALRERGYRVMLVMWSTPVPEMRTDPHDIILSERYRVLFKSKITEYLIQFVLFPWVVWHHDVIITCFLGRLLDRTVFLRWFEFPLLRMAGKKTILNTYGADVMTPRLTLAGRYKYSVVEGYLRDQKYSSLDEAAIEKNREYCQAWADCIVSAIDHVEYLNRVDEFFHMRCVDTSQFVPSCKNANAIPAIIHAPNHRLLKGTEYLIMAADELNREGVRCTLKIVEHRSHDEVLREIMEADVVADQFLVGAYARFAIEAMAFCKPVLCYLREDLFQYNPIWRECPIINSNPDNLKEKLRILVLMSPEERADLGRKGRAYVEKYHSTQYMGGRMDEIIKRVWAGTVKK